MSTPSKIYRIPSEGTDKRTGFLLAVVGDRGTLCTVVKERVDSVFLHMTRADMRSLAKLLDEAADELDGQHAAHT